MKVVVFGAGGLVGGYACRAFEANGFSVGKVTGPSSQGGLDASDFSKLSSLISSEKPDVVFNAIKSSISTDMSETNRLATWSSNVSAPENMARLSQKQGFLLVHISSDWVYEGKEGAIYNEESPIRPLNFYAHTKAAAEEKVRALAGRHLILRTTGVFGHDPRKKDFFSRLKAASEKGEDFQVTPNQFSQPIYAGELAKIAVALVKAGANGTFNAVGPDYVSRCQLAMLLAKEFGFKNKIVESLPSARKIAIPTHLRLDIKKLLNICAIKNLPGQVSDLRNEALQ
jgi:dTDP-4-dehydrorhamnose reductase